MPRFIHIGGAAAPASDIAFDAVSFRAASSSGVSSHTHTPAGTPAAILVLISNLNSFTDTFSVTYGGVAMTEIVGSAASLNSSEDGQAIGFFLNSGIPAGAQLVEVTKTGGGTYGTNCWSVTSSGTVTVLDVKTVANASLADPGVTLELDGKHAFCALAAFSGQNDASGTAPLSDWTNVRESDAGTWLNISYYYDIIGTADVTAGYTATADDVVMVAVALTDE